MSKTIFRLCLGLLLLHSCVEPFPVPRIDNDKSLVVDALITDQPGPHSVVLTYSSNLRNDYTSREFVAGALVWITDDLANQLTLVETSTGKHQTPTNWQLQPNRKYTLHVRLSDGREYESDQQQLQPSGNIERLFAQYQRNSINESDPSKPQHSVAIYMDAHGEENALNLFRWRWKGIYEVLTYPELRTTFDAASMTFIPNPPACASAPCSCCNCWISEFGKEALVSNNQLVSNSQFKNLLITRIPVEPFRFYTKYYIEVEQLSLISSTYTFWKLVQAQQASATDLFQPNVVKIQGNMRSVTNPEDRVYGLATFASVVRRSLFIFRSDIPQNIPLIPEIRDDCRLLDINSSNVRPPFW